MQATAAIGSLAGSAGDSGYQTLPGGIIMQWGIISGPSTSSTSVTFPVPFPSAVFNIQLTRRSHDLPAPEVFKPTFRKVVGDLVT